MPRPIRLVGAALALAACALAAPASAQQVDFHGYFRASALLSIEERKAEDVPAEADAETRDFRLPRLIDNRYFESGFAYLPVNETDWAELDVIAGNEHVWGTVVLTASSFSDATTVGNLLPGGQKGFHQGYVTLDYALVETAEQRARLALRAGVFSERFGYLPRYDTYVLGRTHLAGGQLHGLFSQGPVDLALKLGVGQHTPDAGSPDDRLTPTTYAHFAPSLAFGKNRVGLGVFTLNSFAQDQVLGVGTDADMTIRGVELGLDLSSVGSLYAALSQIDVERPSGLAGAVEVVHSFKPSSLDAYWGAGAVDGELTNLALQLDVSARRLLAATAIAPRLGNFDLTASLFNLYVKAASDAPAVAPGTPYDVWVGRDGRSFHKWGAELNLRALSWLGAALRYDRVNLDTEYVGSDFNVLAPRVIFYPQLGWSSNALIYLQYSHYTYGQNVKQPQQTASRFGPELDTNVFKIQGQLTF